MPDHPSFDLLDPEAVLDAVEGAFQGGARLDGTVSSYPSYINRVYGLGLESGGELIAKFYRPGRWSEGAILDEHRFLADCAAAELPVAAPLPLRGGASLGLACLDEDQLFPFALFPKMGGRNFDAERDEDWLRLGSLVGRLHAVGRAGGAPLRAICGPASLTAPFVDELQAAGLVHPDCREAFAGVCSATLRLIAPLFEGIRFQRIHGDCHRGNILDRSEEGLLLIDFDDMMTGPAIQDLWLLLPDRAPACERELALLSEGYGLFSPLDPREKRLIEPLRFMRMVYFLAWRARQRGDAWFARDFPDWGGKAFWVKELEDLSEQAESVREAF